MTLALGCGTCVPVTAAPLDEALKPLPPVPVLDAATVELGRQLFNETQLSVNNTKSCASCHNLEAGGDDNRAFSLGFDGKPVLLNTPTVFNASLNFKQFWNARVDTLQAQVEQVVVSPMEMGNDWQTVVQTLSALPTYQAAFHRVYPDGVTAANVQDALATYERTLLTPNSRFDQYLQGNTDILTLDEKYGYQRFKEYGCIACHQGANIGGNMYQKFGVMGDYFKARGNPTEADLGRYLLTKDEEDRNVFKVPSLRNVAVTAPYFHDGSAKTLEEAVDIMFKYQLGRVPSAEDKTLIIKFLKTLTGEWAGKPL
ncbi:MULTISPECIES: cytochrome-c peroxidase [Pseudomonas]|jgi:cytochrome c peroxidase|uniref:cytochrome-c peroxidase n=1 Tax=Pseudomonas TaxID=286 RepID=UPI00084A7688|nr:MULTISPECIES: cytochrome c peroxidase [Pseudomonas]MBC8786271.1 c-type cytochrome [Pseudomonas fluorescens]MBK5545157.1 c-type cytochrome [Pseudomonas sp. TH04]NNB70637.1 c-type cytochrome [Pseudomonas fluorescens]OEC69212.1 cytochrome B6 [Pseudomonas sp. AP19]OPB07604.1 cytochrome B6 [Pseudomonas fluorescens]